MLVAAERVEPVQPLREYRLLGVRLDGQGPFLRETKFGSQVSASTFHRVEAGDFIYSRLFAWRGAFGVIPPEMDGCYVSGEFPTFRPISGKVDVEFVRLWFRLGDILDRVLADCTGSTPLTRNRFKEEFFLRLRVPLPPLPEQQRIVTRIEELAGKTEEARTLCAMVSEEEEHLVSNRVLSVFARLAEIHGAVPLGQVAAVVGGGSLPDVPLDQTGEDEVLLVKVSDMNSAGNERILGTARQSLSQMSPFLKGIRVVPAGSIVFPKRGGAIATNKKRILGKPAALDPNLIAVSSRDADAFLPEYILWWSHSFDLATLQTGTSVPQLNKKDLDPLPIPAPEPEEQRRAVGYLDSLQAKVDELKRLQAETQAELDALLPSILDRAFKGEL